MNDRPLGGSAYSDSRIEYMINRRAYTDDSAGLSEALNEVDSDGNGLDVSLKFHLVFTTSKWEAFGNISLHYSQTNLPNI